MGLFLCQPQSSEIVLGFVADSSEATGLKWATPAGGGSGLTYVGGSTFTTSSAVNVNDVFSTTYANYIIRTDIVGSATVAISMRLRVSGSDSSASNYQDMSVTAYGSSIEANKASDATFFRIPGSGAAGSYVNLMVFNPFETAKTGLTMQSVNYATSSIELTNSSLAFSAATSFTGFSLFPASGTITGTVRVYGLANS